MHGLRRRHLRRCAHRRRRGMHGLRRRHLRRGAHRRRRDTHGLWRRRMRRLLRRRRRVHGLRRGTDAHRAMHRARRRFTQRLAARRRFAQCLAARRRSRLMQRRGGRWRMCDAWSCLVLGTRCRRRNMRHTGPSDRPGFMALAGAGRRCGNTGGRRFMAFARRPRRGRNTRPGRRLCCSGRTRGHMTFAQDRRRHRGAGGSRCRGSARRGAGGRPLRESRGQLRRA